MPAQVRTFLARQLTRRRITLHPYSEPTCVEEQSQASKGEGKRRQAGVDQDDLQQRPAQQAEGYLPQKKLKLTLHCSKTNQVRADPALQQADPALQ